jgi:hypothetical protein
MSLALQHLLVLTIVGGAFAFAAWQGRRALSGKSSRVGSCCTRGCGQKTEPTQRTTSDRERVVFIPSESLIKRR